MFRYKIGGHSGDTDNLTFVDWDSPPRVRKERLQVIRKMNAHAETCDSGDNTLVRQAERDDWGLTAAAFSLCAFVHFSGILCRLHARRQ